MSALRKPRLLFEASIRRRPFFRRFAWSLLAAVAALGAVIALSFAVDRALADPTLLLIGQIVGLAAVVWFGLRALLNLWRGLRQRDEDLRFYNQGFVWTRGGQQYKYSWSQLETYREGGHGIYMGGRPLMQWGGYTLVMRDGRSFKLTGRYGDLRLLGKAVRRYAAHVTGIQMGRALREEQPVELHPRLTVWPGGLEIGKQEIPWSELDVRLRNGFLVIRRRSDSGKLKMVRRYNVNRVNNVGGFMELVSATIPNYQRERFEKRRPAN